MIGRSVPCRDDPLQTFRPPKPLPESGRAFIQPRIPFGYPVAHFLYLEVVVVRQSGLRR